MDNTANDFHARLAALDAKAKSDAKQIAESTTVITSTDAIGNPLVSIVGEMSVYSDGSGAAVALRYKRYTVAFNTLNVTRRSLVSGPRASSRSREHKIAFSVLTKAYAELMAAHTDAAWSELNAAMYSHITE